MKPDINSIMGHCHGLNLVCFTGALAVLSAYFIYVFIAFDVVGLSQKASLDNAKILVSDSYSYKVHVTRDNRSSDVSIKIEGETKGKYV